MNTISMWWNWWKARDLDGELLTWEFEDILVNLKLKEDKAPFWDILRKSKIQARKIAFDIYGRKY